MQLERYQNAYACSAIHCFTSIALRCEIGLCFSSNPCLACLFALGDRGKLKTQMPVTQL